MKGGWEVTLSVFWFLEYGESSIIFEYKFVLLPSPLYTEYDIKTKVLFRNEKIKKYISCNKLLFLASCGGNKDYYMFTSFHEPANEGLRYLYSEDGMHWDSVPGVWLKPELGQHQLMRDPSEGTYSGRYLSFVWTTSWKVDLGCYAYSKDLFTGRSNKCIR